MDKTTKKLKKYAAILFLVLLLLIIGIVVWPDGPWYDRSTPPYELRLEPIQYATNFGDTVAAKFGTLTVPENRNVGGSNVIRVAFVRFTCLEDKPGPPIFYLQGGPGTPGIPRAKGELFRFFMTLRHHGDVILIDQRGTGESKPNLDCDMSLGLDTDVQSDIQTNLASTLSQRFSECAEYLRDKGVDLSGYNTNENADDIDDIRRALGYDSLVLLGYSYGTELAQVYIRRHESSVSKAILFGPVAPDMAYKLPSDIQRYFVRLDSMIAADPRHREAMPSLLSTMSEVHNRLTRQSEFLQIPLLDAVGDDAGIGIYFFKTIAFFKPNWEMYLGNEHLEIMTANNVESGFWTRRFPQFYDELRNAEYRTAGNWLRNFRRRNIGNAMSHAMIAATACSSDRRKQARRESDSTVLSDFGISTVRQKEISGSWGNLDLGDKYREPVTSDVKVLIIASELDGVTPMSNAETLQSRFPNSTLIRIDNAAHDELIGTESVLRTKQFLSGLEVDNVMIHLPFFFFPIRAFKHSLQDSLYSVIENHGTEHTLSVYHDLRDRYGSSGDFVFDFEEYTLNELGYKLLSESKYEKAAAILALNVEMYPERSNVYDSYAEVLFALGDRGAAIDNYMKSLHLNMLNNNAYQKLRELGIDLPY